jgi:hypothetical protein
VNSVGPLRQIVVEGGPEQRRYLVIIDGSSAAGPMLQVQQ